MTALSIARHQLTLIIRSKWLGSFGLLFTVLAVFVTYFGQSGESGFNGFSRMIASLLNLNLLLVPLIALLIGSLFLAGEKEDRGLLLLLTYPVSVPTVVLGKFIGLFLALWSVISFGYGAAALVMFMGRGDTSVPFLLLFYCLSLLLAVIFLALSFMIGLYSKNRFQALGISLVIWAFAVLFYEFIVMGISLFATKDWIIGLLSLSIFLNPVELIRVWSILTLDGSSVFGPSLYELTVWANGSSGKALFAVSSFLWVLVPLLLGNLMVKRRVGNE
ncbi:ABC transporter permease subunit [Bacillus sp. ISL-47]|uniref:ABC transporter permease n=1 Tax=Bacillus sp. ISL-47 TaxID=2819130 RepID=UPI001BE52BF7|nr:ABC transporter permease subunit [Bacillus sp. ISL-47]MBT2688458.1 ABC transporter permease subunit [Bacillus sp. ISL-47]MBT2707226.1 ABC transporter permease subunit [Pseudomonas sp. ISL-84]